MEKELTIGGMSCHHCVHAVRKALSELDGVTVRDVQIGSARIEVQPDSVDDARLREVLDEEGYPLEKIT